MPTPLAQGRAAEIFAIDARRVLKRNRGDRDATHEAAAMRYASANGIRVPTVFDANGPEIVMERIDGPTMTAEMARRPWRIARYGRVLGGLHDQIHRVLAPTGLPSRTGGTGALVHGDLHPDNVILTGHGPVVIDWAAAGEGRPDDDVAIAWLIIAASDVPGGRMAAALGRIGRGVFLRAFLGSVDRAAARARLAEIAELRLRDANVRPHEADKVRRLAGVGATR